MKKLLLIPAILATLTACQTPVANTQTQTKNKTVNPTQSQNQTQSITWNKAYGGADKSYDTNLLTLREQIAPKFQVFEFKDEKTGVSIKYNLFTPKNIQAGKKYPLVMFIADASTAGKGTLAPLMQGYGGIIWATDESQAKNPAFVLVPAYDKTAVNDNHETTEQVAITPNLVRHIIKNYPVDNKRVYATGQSMGGMISFYLNSIEPDLFTASMFVGSQWDIKVLKPLTKAKFIYTISAADPKASVGMREVGEMLKQNGVTYAETEFSAKLPQAEQNAQVTKMLAQNKNINFIRFTPTTVLPTHKQIPANFGDHMYSFDYAYLLEPARDWLFKQSK